MKKIKLSDVVWKKHDTYHMDEDGNPYEGDSICVTGTVNGVSIGHYVHGREENEVSCCLSFTEENGGNIFVNRTYVFDDISECTDDFFREKIVLAYNKFIEEESTIKSIFD